MGRVVRDTKIGSREARRKLQVRHDPYWQLVSKGFHLGYRKGKRGRVWIARVYHDGQYHKKGLGEADDIHDSDGATILSHTEAMEAARAFRSEVVNTDGKPDGSYTVSDAMTDYLEWFKDNRKSYRTTKQAIDAHITPNLGDIPILKLTTQTIRKWHNDLAKVPAMTRKGRFGEAKKRTNNDPRARKATANRILTVLKAALNHVWKDGKTPCNDAWRKVSPNKNVDTPKIRFLTEAECARLVNACDLGFRPLVQAALFTGCRYGELTGLVASDFHPDSKTLYIRESKSGKPRHVPLTDEGAAFFTRQTVDKAGDATIFTHPDGKPWGKAHQQRPLCAACKVAAITPAISFHILRHTYGSMLAMRGVPLQVIASALGHADTRITGKHYAHLRADYVADTIRANLPTFDFATDNVATMDRARQG